MLIGIDGNEANVDKRVGIGEYAFELLKKFEEFKVSNIKFQIYLKNQPLPDMPKIRDGWKYKVISPKKMWTRFALPLDLFLISPKPDVFFSPTHYRPGFSPIPTAISVMDLSYIHFPKLFRKEDLYQLTNWTKASVSKASKIFTISNFSRDDIIKTYGISRDKVVVTHLGIKPLEVPVKSKNMVNLEKKFGIKGKYILFVGTLQPRKNITKLIEAFSDLKEKDLELVVVGKKGWQYDEILLAPEKFNVSNRVKFLDFVEDEDLPLLYKNAVCFVLPSLYEGFGLPVLEAMKFGCPVITSNVSSLPEAGGDAALYFNPSDTNDIREKIEKVIGDPKLRESMSKKGFDQIKKFSWEKTAKQTLQVLEQLAK